MGLHIGPAERQARTDRHVDAFVQADDRELPVVITNVSNRGCMLRGVNDLLVGEQIRVEVPRLGSLIGHIRWIANGKAGVEFVPGSDIWEESDTAGAPAPESLPGPCAPTASDLPSDALAQPWPRCFAPPARRFGAMSIRKQIALHPASKDHVNQALGDAVHHLMYCAKMCLSCADACMAEAMDMKQCIRLCLDCSDICEATARLGLRRTGDDQPMLRELLELCGRMCEQCAAECERHDHEHCKLCAQICRECAADCAKAAASLS